MKKVASHIYLNRYGKANKEYMRNYDDKAPSKHIMYLEKSLDKVNLAEYTEESEKGLIREVDLEYPHKLHDSHNDYPFAAEKIGVIEDMLSNYCEKIRQRYNVSIGKVKKLVPTLSEKQKYVLHNKTVNCISISD